MFGVWLVVSHRISKLCLSVPPVRGGERLPDKSNTTKLQPRIGISRTDLGGSGIDVWFALSIVPAVDAMTVVFTFNGQLIRQFHYAVSQRLLFLASAISWVLTSQYPMRWVIPGCVACKVFSDLLDRFESPIASKSHSACWGTLSTYSQKLRYSESTWAKAVLNSATVTAFGLVLSLLLQPPLTFLVPIAHIFFEVIFISPYVLRFCLTWSITVCILIVCQICTNIKISPPVLALVLCQHLHSLGYDPSTQLAPATNLGTFILGYVDSKSLHI